MCVIFACYSGLPSAEELQRAHYMNDDGAGMAWLGKDGKLYWEKGFKDADALLEKMNQLNGEWNWPVVIHFRTASQGGVDPLLTHPFPINEDASLRLSGKEEDVLFHNGTWMSWKQELKLLRYWEVIEEIPKGPWSDSRSMAIQLYWMGDGYLDIEMDDEPSRVAIFKADGKLTLINEDKWLRGEGGKFLRSSQGGMPGVQTTHYLAGGRRCTYPSGVHGWDGIGDDDGDELEFDARAQAFERAGKASPESQEKTGSDSSNTSGTEEDEEQPFFTEAEIKEVVKLIMSRQREPRAA